MKYRGIYWTLFAPMIRKSVARRYWKALADRAISNGKAEYRRLLSLAEDLGPGNPMATNAYFAYVFAAAWLGSGREIPPDGMGRVMTDVLESPLPRTFFGLTDLNKTPQKWERDMRKYEKWYKAHGADYPVNWVVHFDDEPTDGKRASGERKKEESFYYFTRCPICEFCAREGISELMPALCATDEVMFRLQHGRLRREHTIAKGEGICDYLITGDKAEEA